MSYCGPCLRFNVIAALSVLPKMKIRIPRCMKQFLCSLPAAPILCWTIANVKNETVNSSADLLTVGFGWPVKWIYQDFSRSSFARFPQDIKLSWIKFDQLPTHIDWLLFALNTCLFSLVLMSVYNALPTLIKFIRHRNDLK